MALVQCSECGREISDRAPACPHCACPMIIPASLAGHGTPPPIPASTYISPEDYRVSGEKGALWIGTGILVTFVLLTLVTGVGFLLLPVVLVITAIVIWTKQGQLIGNAVKVSPNQFREINEVAEVAAHRLGMQRPEVFIKYDPVINAFATGFLARKSVILHSALVEAMGLDELCQVIGHEFSHIKCGHTNLVILTNSAGINVPVVSQILGWVFLLWSRKAEYTCDRGGLLACREPMAAVSAMCKLAVGPQQPPRVLAGLAHVAALEPRQAGRDDRTPQNPPRRLANMGLPRAWLPHENQTLGLKLAGHAGAQAQVVLHLRQAAQVLERFSAPVDLGQPGLGHRLGLEVEDYVGVQVRTPSGWCAFGRSPDEA